MSVYHLPRFSELQSKRQYLVLLNEKGPRILNGNLGHENKPGSCDFHVSSWILQTASHLLVMEFEIRIYGIQIPPSTPQANVGGAQHRALQESQNVINDLKQPEQGKGRGRYILQLKVTQKMSGNDPLSGMLVDSQRAWMALYTVSTQQ